MQDVKVTVRRKKTPAKPLQLALVAVSRNLQKENANINTVATVGRGGTAILPFATEIAPATKV